MTVLALRSAFFIGGIFSFCVVAQGAGVANDWLMKMSQAARTLNYEGTFVYQHNNQLEAMQIVHRVDNGSINEKLVSLNGVPREVIRDNQEVRCYLPDENSVVVEHRKANGKSFPSILPENLHLLDNNYEIRLGRKGRIADREAQLVAISPQDQYRYGYALWADSETGLVLAADLTDTRGRAIERFMFTQINIGSDIEPSALRPRSEGKNMVWHRGSWDWASEDLKPAWKVTRLPKGFALSASMISTMPMRSAPAEHIVFSDGLAAVSVFIERMKRGKKPGIRGPTSMGAVHAYSTVVDDYRVTVVGEVPAATVAQIAGSVTAGD